MLNSVLTFAIYVDHIIAQRICTSKFHTVKEVEKEEEFSCILKCGYNNKRRKEKVGIYWNYRNKMRYHSNSTEMCIVLIVASNYKLQTKRAEKEEKN